MKKPRIFAGDFETTVYDEQEDTEVWAGCCAELFSDTEPQVFHTIDEMYDFFLALDCDILVYFHNLKFDGEFWLWFIINVLHYEQAYTQVGEDVRTITWQDKYKMKNKTFQYCISDMGQWYNITIRIRDHTIEIRDSLKLLPFSIKEIGKSFNTPHQKLDMEYKGYRYAGCEITDEEKKYIQNDVYVLKEALEIMYEEKHTKLTIGSCCLSEYHRLIGNADYKMMFPKLNEIELDASIYGAPNVDAYIRKSYKGGWCYIVKEKANQLKYNGTTADVNSLYPSMMHSESGNQYPIGKPKFWSGNEIPSEAIAPNKYFFVRIRTRFYIKPNHLPFIQIKGNYLYKGTESLESSDVWDKKTQRYYTEYYDDLGRLHDTRVTLTLTMTDYYLFLEHYNQVDFEILDGCYFYTAMGIFDEYIDTYKKIKLECKGAKRTLAKLYLNNLYGKFASSTESDFKVAYMRDDQSVGFFSVPADDKTIGYIPVGSAITSYARNFTIRAAQKNYYGKDKRGFIYADTDSIHCDLRPEEIKGITVHDKNFCCWKLEASWDVGLFVRQKTYIEHVVAEDLEPIEKPYYNVKCAGMPQRCKNLFLKSMGEDVDLGNKIEEYEQEFIDTPRVLQDFKVGLKIPGKLLPRRIKGGVLLVDTMYEMR